MFQERKYLKVKSLAWWSGFIPGAVGLFIAAAPVHGLVEWTQTLQTAAGSMSPNMLIVYSATVIGLRGQHG